MSIRQSVVIMFILYIVKLLMIWTIIQFFIPNFTILDCIFLDFLFGITSKIYKFTGDRMRGKIVS